MDTRTQAYIKKIFVKKNRIYLIIHLFFKHMERNEIKQKMKSIKTITIKKSLLLTLKHFKISFFQKNDIDSTQNLIR
jgi:hypothetical protein